MSSFATISVMATAAFKEAYLELAPQFERASDHTVITTWATTSEIVSRACAYPRQGYGACVTYLTGRDSCIS